MYARTARLGLAASLAAAIAALCWRLPPAVAGQPRAAREADALQQVADVVLIESECRTLNVDYAALFAFAERNGIDPLEIMPAGQRRAAFDAAYRRRAHDVKGPALCGTLAADRAAAIPGVFTPR